MANTLLPVEERNLTPAEVSALDRRRRRGHFLLVVGFQTGIIALFVGLLFAGQDLAYSPGWMHPMAYWDGLLAIVSATCLIRGLSLRKGTNEFFSY